LPAEPTRRAIVVGPKAHELRRYVGLSSWAVLEEMMQVATGPADRLVAEVSIRSLAASLGVSKDTVTRAVRRLRDLGVVEAEQARSQSGSFRAGSYRLCVPAACLALEPGSLPAEAAPVARPSPLRRTSSRRSADQLSLLSEA
jgi:DNA-binding transcriptional MocR family regulator